MSAFVHARSRTRRGASLFLVVVTLMVVATLSAALMSVSVASNRLSSGRVKRGKLRGSAEQGVAQAYYMVWNSYLNTKAGHTPGNYKDYSDWLTNTLKLLDGGTYSLPALTLSDRTGLATTVSRRDVGGQNATYLTVVSVATALDGEKSTITSIIKMGGKPYAGFNYGLLTRNVNCMMCHLNVNNVDLFNNKTAANYGTYPGAKVGITEQLSFRKDAVATFAGQLYTRGPITDSDGNPVSSLAPYGIDGYKIDSTTGNIIQSSSGTMTKVDLYAATGDPPPANAQYYQNYPTDLAKQQQAGELPSNFPPPIPDSNGDRKIDSSEFASFATSATGTLSGGVIYQASGYAGTSLPAAGNTTKISGSNAGSGKNTILVGTKTNPIVIDGTIALDGDVIITGYVQGTGEIAAKGNLYIMGDLQYADGTDTSGNRTYGVDKNGNPNAIAVTAGGNVFVGDYIANKSGTVMSPSDSSLLNVEIGQFNRDEWTKTQPTLPNATGTMVANSTYDPTYVPRYYTMNPGDPVYVTAPVPGQTTLTYKNFYWDPTNNVWKAPSGDGTEHTLTADAILTPKPTDALLTLNPTGAWISNSDLNGMFQTVDKSRTAGAPVEIDALMYSSNMIFALARSGDSSKGNLNINGAIIAADTGILAGGTVNMNYDKRTAQFIHVEDPTSVTPYTLSYTEK